MAVKMVVMCEWAAIVEGSLMRLPLVAKEQTLARWVDVSEQNAGALPPEPNLMLVELVCESAVADVIDGDGDYHVVSSVDI